MNRADDTYKALRLLKGTIYTQQMLPFISMISPCIAIGFCCSIAMLCCYFSILANGFCGLFFNSVTLLEILMGNVLKSLWSPELCKAPWQWRCSKHAKTQHTPGCFLFTAQKTVAPDPLGLMVWGKSSTLMWTGCIRFLFLPGISDFGGTELERDLMLQRGVW